MPVRDSKQNYPLQFSTLLDLAHLLCYMEEEFEEEDVWDMMRETGGESPDARNPKAASFLSSVKPSSSSRKIPRSNAVREENGSAAVSRNSAPVAIPSLRRSSEAGELGGDAEDGEEDEEDRVPPHVWLAKKMERARISSFSVCEGAGRTLKGRDQRKLRNAVLTRTGFLE